ncbi:MAG TPA: T9SS type A sorting domain-containing protein, partial [Chitinophagales bacterium]|nr:T9SS type A sorting domain-containing protein [Chitinophagales bacterium]
NTSGHIISEGEFNRVKWNINTTAGTYVVPFGRGAAEYLPVSLTTSGAVSPGSNGSLTFAMYPVGSWINTTNLPVGVTNFLNNNGTDNSAMVIDRFWRIEPANYSTKPALTNLTFTYRDPEWSVANNTIIESNLIAQRYNTGTNEWDDFMPGTVTTPASDISTVATLPSAQLFTWWTLVDNRSPLPIELVNFNAKCDGNKVNITWQTNAEKNNNYFEVERSTDGSNFQIIEKVFSQNPNSNTLLSYQSVDNNSLEGKVYYRLKQVDLDGKSSYSSVIVVTCSSAVIAPTVSIFPNPTTNNITVDIKGLKGKKTILIYDVIGQEMTKRQITNEDENIQETFDVSTFAKATYLLRIDVDDHLHQIIKFLKN